jgi:transposase
MVLNGILYVLTSGCRWCKYGSYKTAWRRLKEMGVWDSIFKTLASMRGLSRVSVDSTTVEAKKGERWWGMTVSSIGRAPPSGACRWLVWEA